MPFTEIDFMSPIRAFLMSYPALKPYERLEIDYMKIDPASPIGQGNAVAFVGINRPVRRTDILGNTVLSEQANMLFIIRRWTNDNELRRDVGDFMFNYLRWINYENEMRGTTNENPLLPHFSDTQEERITADGGMEMGATEQPNVDEFQVQIHLEYQTSFESEEF